MPSAEVLDGVEDTGLDEALVSESECEKSHGDDVTGSEPPEM